MKYMIFENTYDLLFTTLYIILEWCWILNGEGKAKKEVEK
jgi:hypothetical protein